MTKATSPLKIAVVGIGLIGQRHAQLISKLSEFELCAIIDPADGSQGLANELSASHYFDLKSFLESDAECDGVIIATPNETHEMFAISCINQGLPCLIEKPLASNSKDASSIAEASRNLNVAVLVGHHRRHHAVSMALKEKIDQGELGQLVGAQLTWMLKKPNNYFIDGSWRLQKGGGPIWINLIHEIDLLRYFIGEITEVSAMVSNTVRGNAVEDTGVVNMRCQNGALISAILSDTSPSPWHFEGGSGENPNISKTGQSGLRIFGTKGSVEFPSLTQWQHKTDDGHWGTPIYPLANKRAEFLGGEAALISQLYNFADVIHGKSEPLVSAQDGVQSVRVVEAIHEAARDGSNKSISTV